MAKARKKTRKPAAKRAAKKAKRKTVKFKGRKAVKRKAKRAAPPKRGHHRERRGHGGRSDGAAPQARRSNTFED
jgi:hypothetical protein